MESEKVKEIKESLKQEIHLTAYVDRTYAENVSLDLLKDILTLINDFESENERLLESCKNCHYIKDLEIANGHAKELKDRIAELEKQMCRNEDLHTATEKLNDTIILEQFAERLKQKFNDTEYRAMTKRKTISVEKLKAQMDWILHEVVIKYIDETLKEMIK